MQNVIVLGGSYGGARAAQLLAQNLSRNYRVILIDRNSHANHLYVIPRMGIIPGHEHKAFIPYRNLFHFNQDPNGGPLPVDHHHLILHATVTALSSDTVTLDRTFPELGFHSTKIPFSYAVYALGSHLPAPINLWAKEREEELQLESERVEREVKEEEGEEQARQARSVFDGTKPEGVEWLRRNQKRVQKAENVLIVGGGALGIQFATDIKSYYPTKQVTLLHSRHRLLPRFDPGMHNEITKAMEDLQVDLVLGERLDIESTKPENKKYNERGQRVVRTLKGREIAADLVLLCTGQTPNTEILAKLSKDSIDPESKLAYVLPTMQLGVRSSRPPSPDFAEPQSGPSTERLAESLESSTISESAPSSSASSVYAESASPAESAASSELGHDESDVEAEPELEPTPFPHIFVVGDSADAFGAIKAGHVAYFQAEVAARNILALTEAVAAPVAETDSDKNEERERTDPDAGADAEERKKDVKLLRYKPGPPGIKVTLGLNRQSVYQINSTIGKKDTPEPDDLDAGYIWAYFGMQGVTDEQMHE